MSQCDKTVGEMYLSLNGFDNIAIAMHFGARLGVLRERDGDEAVLTPLAFVDQRRKGLSDSEAYKAAMNLTLGELAEYFAPEEDDLDPENPNTESGKDSAP